MTMEPIAVPFEEAATLIRVERSQLYKMFKHNPELRAAEFYIPGLAVKRIHVARLRALIDRIAEEQGGRIE
jgi:hypothetical protein